MKVKTLGKNNRPVIVCIPGMFCDYTSVLPFAEYLADDFFVIIPTLDGHYKDSPDYSGADKQAEKLLAKLKKLKVRRITLLQGTSMGAEVALAFARCSDIPVDRCVFDGGPFFDFPDAAKAFMRRRFSGFLKKYKGKTAEDVLKDPLVRWLGGEDARYYRGMIDSFVRSADFITPNTVRNAVETCYACKLPDFSEEEQRRFQFCWSEKEPAHKSKKRVMEKYPSAAFTDWLGNGYVGFQAKNPEGYALFLADQTRFD